MAFPQRFLDELTSRCDIVDIVSRYVTLQRKGNNYFGLCPFHNENTPSFSVSPDKQMYYCFGCKKGGSVIRFTMEIENLGYTDAIQFLAKRSGLTVPEDDADPGVAQRRSQVLALNKEAAQWFHENLSKPEGKAVRDYLVKRKIRPKTAVDFGLGASLNSWDSLMTEMLRRGHTKEELLGAGLIVQNEKGRLYDKFRNRLVFPVIDVRGDVVAFGGRVLDKSEPKYLNTSETIAYSKRRNLYGIHLAKKTRRKNIILCEGNIDVITLHQAGFDNAVASMGTALTLEQTKLLSHYTKELVLCYDNDRAGQEATEKAISLLKNSEFSVRVLSLPQKLEDGQYKKQDVDDFIKQEGAPAFESILESSAGQVEYRLNALTAKFNLDIPEQKTACAQEICALLAAIPNAVERDIYAGRAAALLDVSKDTVVLDMERVKGTQRKQAFMELKRENQNVIVLHQPKKRELRYEDIHSAMAEEGILRLLFRDSSLIKNCQGLHTEDFSSPLLGRVYQELQKAASEGRDLSLAALEGILSPDEISHVAGLLQKIESLAMAGKSLPDYIRIIEESAAKRREETDKDPLLVSMEKNKRKKGYGGKRT